MDQLYRTVQMGNRLLVHGDNLCPRRGKIGNVFIRVFDHKVHIQRQRGNWAKRLYHWGTNSDVGHEVTIHYINVDIVSACLLYRLYLFAEAGKISREDRWG